MEDTANMESTDPPSYLAESTVRIKELHEAEKKIVLLVETAGEALEVLSHDENAEGRDSEQAIRERILRFRELAARYFTLVNDVQLCLRSNTRYLRKTANMTPGTNRSIPFRASVAGYQKELEIWTAAVKTIHERVEHIRRIAHERDLVSDK